MLLNLLEVSEQTTDIVTYCIIGAIALLALIVVAICVANRNKQFDTKALAYAAVCLATSFVLSFIKVTPVPNGGSITLASFVPVLIYTYAYGPVRGMFVGIIFGLLNFISGPWILTPFTFLLDYVLAFAMIGLFGFFRKATHSMSLNIVLGTVVMFVGRFVMHLISGILYFQADAVWAELPADNAFLYSFLYQLVYLPADALISLIVMLVFVKAGTMNRLLNMIRPKEFPLTPAAPAGAPASEAASEPSAEKKS